MHDDKLGEIIDENNYMNFINYYNKEKNLVYSGQFDCTWSLNSSLFRSNNISDANCEHEILGQYKKLNNSNELDNVQLISKARHHGISTRLLDWTKDIRIALYFACCDMNFTNKKNYDGELFISEYESFVDNRFKELRAKLMVNVAFSSTIEEVSQHLYNGFINEIPFNSNFNVNIKESDLIELNKIPYIRDNILLKYLTKRNTIDYPEKLVKDYLISLVLPIFIETPISSQRMLDQKGLFMIIPGKFINNYQILGFISKLKKNIIITTKTIKNSSKSIILDNLLNDKNKNIFLIHHYLYG